MPWQVLMEKNTAIMFFKNFMHDVSFITLFAKIITIYFPKASFVYLILTKCARNKNNNG